MKKITLAFFLALYATGVWSWQPKKDIEVVVGFPPGGSTDLIARVMADGFNRHGLKTIVSNRPGAGGAIAARQVIDSKGDRYVIMITGTAFLFNHLLKSPAANYDPVSALDHLLLIGTVENHIYANSTTVVGDIKKVLTDIKNQTRKYTIGVTNPGAEFTAKLIEHNLGVPLNLVKYTGSSQAAADLLGGHIDMVIDSGSGMLSRLPDATRVRLIATLNPRNTDDRATVDAVLAGVSSNSWFGMSLPPGSPPDVLQFYRDLMIKTILDPKTQAALKDIGLVISGRKDLQQVITEDLTRFKPIAANVTRP